MPSRPRSGTAARLPGGLAPAPWLRNPSTRSCRDSLASRKSSVNGEDKATGLRAALLEVGENLGEGVPANVAKHRVVRRICSRPQPGLQGPAASSTPCRVINGQRAAEDAARVSRQVHPCHHEIARRIAHAEKAEIDHSAEFMVGNQQVSRMQIAVDPEWLACPRRYR